jgi:uncharacterized protein YbjT (DUF2867 family)
MSGKKIITVFGATGNQGGGVVDTFLNDSKLKNDWAVRGITRDVNKESSKKLAAQGVEVVTVSKRTDNPDITLLSPWTSNRINADIEITQGRYQ